MLLYNYAWYFLIYSFLGWCVEVVYQAVKRGKVINRGFLCGPVCPVYGFGVIAVFSLIGGPLIRGLTPFFPALSGGLTPLFPALSGGLTPFFPALSGGLVSPFPVLSGGLVPLFPVLSGGHGEIGTRLASLALVFVSGVILATFVELTAGWLLDMAFHARWWDYSGEPLNFRGYICLRFSLIWGAGIVFVVAVLQPLVEHSVLFLMPKKIGLLVLSLAYLAYLADFLVTLSIVVGLNRRLEELDQIQNNMRIVSDYLSQTIGTRTIQTQQSLDEARVQMALAGYETRDEINRYQKTMAARADELRSLIKAHPVFGSGRILSAFPKMEHRRYPDILKNLLN